MDCPLLVWMLTYNRTITAEEYEQCYQVTRQCVPHATLTYAPQSSENIRQMIAYLLPLLMMRHRRIPRAKWRDNITNNGKRWIEQLPENPMDPNPRPRAMIGYHLAYENCLVGMVMTQGRYREVINIGIGVKELCVDRDSPNTPVPVYAESLHHKLTPLEISYIPPTEAPDVILRRLGILLALKQAYIKAIGQPIGFDWSRLEFDLPHERADGDGYPLVGWEFRIWQSKIAVLKDNDEVEEQTYQCASAFFRGTPGYRFIWQKDSKELDSWVQFLTIDQLITVLPKLMD